MPWNNWTKVGGYPVRFSSWPLRYRANSHSPENFWKTLFADLEKARDQVPCDKLWGVLREYGVDDRLLLAAMSLYSYSDICVRVGGVKSQRFTVGDGLQQRCAVTTLHSLYELDRVDSYSRVDEGVTVGSCRINGLLFVCGLLLSMERDPFSAKNQTLRSCRVYISPTI